MNKKSITAFLMAAAIAFASEDIPTLSEKQYVSAAASQEIVIDDMSFSIDPINDNALILTSYSGSSTDLTIPQEVEGKVVTGIDDKVFYGDTNIRIVTLPDTINYFGMYVFKGSSVQSVNIPKSLRVIPTYTFENCQELDNVYFHDEIAIIANTAFKKTNVTIPDELRDRVTGTAVNCSNTECSFTNDDWSYTIISEDGYIHTEITRYNGSDTDIIIPGKLNSVDVTVCNEDTFPDISIVKTIEFPDSVSFLDISFAGSDIESAVLPGVNEIPASEFENCTSLNSVTFSDEASVCTIGANAFKNCTSLKMIPSGKNIGRLIVEESAFENSGIEELSPEYSSEIGKGAFSRCASLTSVKLTDAVIYSDAFYSCDSLFNVSLNNAKVSPRAFRDCTALKQMTLGGNVFLDDLSVYNCDTLEDLDITDCTLSSYNAFRNCPKLYSINSEYVFSSASGDFIPEYKDFIFTHFNGSDNVGFINQYVIARTYSIANEITNDSMSDMEKVRLLHDWVCENTKYTEGTVGERENHNDASVFMNEYTVCEGYARACNLLYHAAGLETYYVHGNNHAWNIVNIEGTYFHVDTTWDDVEPISRKWFLRSDAELKSAGGNHAEWSLYVPSPLHSFQSDELPECGYMMGDVNADGDIGVADMVTLQSCLIGGTELESERWVLSDVCYDGKINIYDLTALRRIITEEALK